MLETGVETGRSLAGLRIFLVEDEMLLAVLVVDILTDAGCVAIGPFDTVSAASAAAIDKSYDFALLDVNLRGENGYPVAELVAGRGIPFLILSGYGAGAVPDDRPDWRALGKPFGADELTAAIRAELNRRG